MVHDLPDSFVGTGEVKGFLFELIERNSNAYLFKVIREDGEHWEVFEKKLTPLCIDFTKRIYSDTEFKVRYPKSNDFGVWAKCCGTLERARYFFDSIKTPVK